MEFTSPSWEDIFDMCVEGANRIEELGIKFDVIIALSRGGLIPGRIISDLLEIKDIIVLDVKYYTGIGLRSEKPKITELVTNTISSKNILVVDDVVDSGESVKASAEYLKTFHPKTMKVFTLHAKPHRTVNPDLFIRETTAWIIYPWELLECFKELKEKGFNTLQIVRETGLKEETLEKVRRLYDKRRKGKQS
ncbi:MAG: phosphoribosyltransferase [Nitrososphaeria archaeon]